MKISVIIPVYNKADYILGCVESLLTQDFDDFEIVAVNDGSTDESGRICDELAKAHARFHIHHTTNQGVTAARRYAVEQAKGTYIVFVDSDDALMPHALHTLYDQIEATHADEVIGTFCTQDGVQSPVVYQGETEPEPLIRQIITGKNRFPVLWAIIFRKEILQGCLDTPRDIIEGEDKLMQVKVLMKEPKVYFIPDCVYRYTLGLPNSRNHTLEREMLYDDILRQVLAPQWDSMKAAFTLHQLKEYEKFIHNKQYGVRKAYYETTLNSQLSTSNSQLPLYDRLVWMLPPQVGRRLVMLYRWVINKKQKNL
jgi:glycosyltransferase involved in cell wall biosynthesis